MARITNVSSPAVTLQISDLLDNMWTQYQDGVKVLTLLPSASALIPNLQACNSVSLKKLLVAGMVTVDLTAEPSNIIGATGV